MTCCCMFDIVVKQVFKDLDFLGWYNTGELSYESDIQIHKQVSSPDIFFLCVLIQYICILIHMYNAGFFL